MLHTGARPWHKWEPVLPQLTQQYDVLVPTLPGFLGGPPLPGRATIDLHADAVEAAMDDAGFDTAHCVGNSLGGWVVMELARRGRARSVVAFSPAGGWTSLFAQKRIKAFFRTNHLLTRLMRPLIPLVMALVPVRALTLRMVVTHPRKVRRVHAVRLALDTMAGGDLNRALAIADSHVQPYSDLGIPTLVAWSERDRLTPLKHDGEVWRQAAPFADWRVLPGLGHLPMFDDPDLTLATILACTSRVR